MRTSVPWKSLFLTIEPKKGATIHDVCPEMVELARLLKQDIRFVFNAFEMTAKPDSNPEQLIRAYFQVRY